jgi:hypothetical protein
VCSRPTSARRELRALIPGKPAWSTYAANPRRCGTVFAIDGQETWLVHNHLNPDEPEFDSIDRDWSIRQILGVGADFTYDVISKEDWVGRRLVANRFRDRRVFIAGDAAHLWVPYAGYGMNAGIADAVNLAWLLAARLQGWGEEPLLDAYEAERQPITEQVSHFAMDHAAKMIRARRAVPANIEAPGPEGDALRAEIGRETYELNVQQFCCAGLNFGYFYAGSPLIVGDGEAPPAYTMGSFTASTVPGCRAPQPPSPSPPRMQQRLGVAAGLCQALEDQVAGGLEGGAVEAPGHRLVGRIAGVLPVHHLGHALEVARTWALVTTPWCSQLAMCWLLMRSVARSSIRPTLWMSGTLEQPTPWSTQRTT